MPRFLVAGCVALLFSLQVPSSIAQNGYRLNRPVQDSSNNGGTRFEDPFAPSTSRQSVVEVKVRDRGSLNLQQGVVDTFKSPQQEPPFTGVVQVEDFGSMPEARVMLRLKNHDVALVVDKSSSMRTMDCPGSGASAGGGGFGGGRGGRAGGGGPGSMGNFGGRLGTRFSNLGNFAGGFGGFGFGISRWEWVRRQSTDLARALAQVPGAKLNLVLFDSRFQTFDNVAPQQLEHIFNSVAPGSGTNPTSAIKDQLERYFANRSNTPGAASRPLVIACITDGAPTNANALRNLLIDTTHKIRGKQDVSVTFFQVGNDPDGNELLPELDRGLTSEGATFDMVSVRYFPELLKTGLARALVETVGPEAISGRK